MSKITTIAFDYGGVLAYRINDSYLRHMADAAGAPPERFAEALWRHRNGYDAGDLDAGTYWRMVVSEATGSDAVAGTAAGETIEVLKQLDSFAWATMNPGMMRWLSTLQQEGYRRVLISNMAAETYDMIIKNSLWLPRMERVILSGWLRVNKPDREIFLEAARQMEVDPGQMLFIDDLDHNVAGAQAAGLQSLQFSDAATLAAALKEQYPQIPRRGLEC